jgi:hypothetical protein
MDKTIAQLNIEHFHRKLEGETDPTTRQTVVRLLAEEEAKLARLQSPLGLGVPAQVDSAVRAKVGRG